MGSGIRKRATKDFLATMPSMVATIDPRTRPTESSTIASGALMTKSPNNISPTADSNKESPTVIAVVMMGFFWQKDLVSLAAKKKLPFRSFLSKARHLTLSHDEKCDGTGYQQGLSAEGIPLAGRLMALADVDDALRSVRPYKEAWTHERCLSEIQRLSGTHFDPKLVKLFIRLAPTGTSLATSKYRRGRCSP